MSKNRLKRYAVLFLFPLFLFSCKQEIVDFFEAIQDYGYRSLQPLGSKKIAVNENLLGGYVYQELPIIISKKDANTYEIKFLSVLLYKEDVSIEAHATQLGGATFLNLAMGDYYCFMQANLIMNQLEVKLLKDALKEYIPQAEIKGWLEKNPETDTYAYSENGGEYDLDIYFSFVFEKITINEALRIQQSRLRQARMILFQSCDDYVEYENLLRTYPNDEFTDLAIISLLENCETIEELEAFIAYFPKKEELIEKAKVKITYIIETERLAEFMALDQKSFEMAAKTNTIDGYELFQLNCKTSFYKDSAIAHIAVLASLITKDEVEWKWTNGEYDKAFNLIFYKIDYLKNNSEANWLIDLMTIYTLKYNQVEMSRKVLHYFDLLVELHVTGDDFLNLCISKGFVLWLLNDMTLAIQAFELKLDMQFESDQQTVKDRIKVRYDSYVSLGIVFPDQKTNWKKIKKLKAGY